MSSFQPEHSYRQLPPICYADCQPTPVKAPQFIAFNQALAAELALPEAYWHSSAGLDLFSGNQLPTWTAPLAQAYAGHQFAHYVPKLGDGRAILLAEVRDSQGKRLDLQLKGAGQTPYSRRGDGRSPIGPVIREYLISEAMHALGVPTTRALAAVSTGEVVFRDEGLAGAILTRVASSHIRIGTLQFAASQSDNSVVKALADYVIERHYPTLTHAENPYRGLLHAVIAGQAALVAQWMSLGFIHGVMNTDNMLLSAETIDYGPCAFMEAYNAQQVFSYIDQQGRYAYKNQPAVAQWNLARLAEALLGLLAPDQAAAIELAMAELNQFPDIYQQQWLSRFAAKLGIANPVAEDRSLIEDFLNLLQDAAADFTLSFRDLLNADTPYLQQKIAVAPLQQWLARWQQRLASQQVAAHAIMAKANPVLIPRNHLIQQVIDEMSDTGDLTLFNTLHKLWQDPFSATPENAPYQQPASAAQCVKQTFCGT
ncbi:protein adenylyltransferase SelO [Alishewanella sp. HL-SH05]|uniref:protein adenylyltransferase SelO n=1 Tax=Alishewanella sp. HL-SH05 TaxID=3461145 RepID=UPI004042ABDF